MPSIVLFGLIVIIFVIGGICMSEDCAPGLVFFWALGIGMAIWFICAGNTPFEKWDTETYEIMEKDNTQYSLTDKAVYYNVNQHTNKFAKPGQRFQVETPSSAWAGGVYWIGTFNKYAIVDPEPVKE
jgi:hypothetical protein